MTLIYEALVRSALPAILTQPAAPVLANPSVGTFASFIDSVNPGVTPYSFSLSHPGGSNPAILLLAALKGTTDSAGGSALTLEPTYDNILMTQIGSSGNNVVGSVATARAFLIQSPSTGDNGFSLSFSAAQAVQCAAAVGINLVNVGAAGSGTAGVQNITDLSSDSMNITTGADGSLVIGMITVQGNDGEPFTAGSGYTLLTQGNTGFSGSTDISFAVQHRLVASAAEVAFDAAWSTSDGRSMVAVEIEGVTA